MCIEDVALRMMSASFPCFYLSSQHIEPPLMYACRNCLLRAVRAMLARCPKPVAQYLEPPFGVSMHGLLCHNRVQFKSLVSVAAAHGHAKIVELLAQNGANVNSSSQYRDHAMYGMVEIGRASCRERVCQYV